MRYCRAEREIPVFNTQEILQSIQPGSGYKACEQDRSFPVLPWLALVVLMYAAYWPIARAYCWLVLFLAYLFGVDGAAWPGPYTPFPSQF